MKVQWDIKKGEIMKIISAILILVMLLGITGCENNHETDNTANDANSENVATTLGLDSQTVNEDENNYDNLSYALGSEIYVNYKDGRGKNNDGSVIVYYSSSIDDVIVFQYDNETSYEGTLADVFDYLNDGTIIKTIWKYTDAEFLPVSGNYLINKKSEDKIKVGELDTVRISGSVTDENGRECHVYGYTFIMDNVPCFLGGFVFSEEQEQSLISSIEAEVDAMMATVRDEM